MNNTQIEKSIIAGNVIFGLAEKTPIFAIDGRIYYCEGEEAGDDIFMFNRKTFRIREGPLINTLEEISDLNLHEEFEKHQEKFIKEELKKYNTDEKAVEHGGEYARIVRFVVGKVFPHLNRENSELLDKFLEVPEKDIKEKKDEKKVAACKEFEKEVETYAGNRVKELEGEDKKARKLPKENKLEKILFGQNLSKSTRDDSAFLSLTDGYNFAILGDKIYLLSSVVKGEDLRLGKRKYALMPAYFINDFKKDFAVKTVNEICLSALQEKLKDSEEFLKLKAERSDIEYLCKQDAYHEQDFGFKSTKRRRNRDYGDEYGDEDEYYTHDNGSKSHIIVYVDVPEYVLKDPYSGRLYHFKGHKLGIELCGCEMGRGGEPNVSRNPFSLTRVGGPFYFEDRKLCMGNYRSPLGNGNRGKEIAKYLVDARNVVLRGYARGSNPRTRLENYRDNLISEEEVKRRKLPITNTNYQNFRLRRDDY